MSKFTASAVNRKGGIHMGIFDFLKRKKNVPAPQAANTAPARLPDSAKACA